MVVGPEVVLLVLALGVMEPLLHVLRLHHGAVQQSREEQERGQERHGEQAASKRSDGARGVPAELRHGRQEKKRDVRCVWVKVGRTAGLYTGRLGGRLRGREVFMFKRKQIERGLRVTLEGSIYVNVMGSDWSGFVF